MSLILFRVSWNEDDSIFRDIEILSGQTYFDLHENIKLSLQMPADMHASFYVSDDSWRKGRQISSSVEKNLRDAIALSMKKTPIGALINDPHQKFVYECDHPKEWVFYVDLITLMNDPVKTDLFPRCVKTEGMSPTQLGAVPILKDTVMELEERYDLNKGEEGFGDEGDNDEEGAEEEEQESGTDEFNSEDF